MALEKERKREGTAKRAGWPPRPKAVAGKGNGEERLLGLGPGRLVARQERGEEGAG